MSNYKEQAAVALLRARERFATMRKDEYGYEELRVALIHLEELYDDLVTEALC